MRSLLSIIGILVGGLSVFRLGSLLWDLELSQIMNRVVAYYGALIRPIRVIFEPLLQAFLEVFSWQLPDWWVHLFVTWLVIGGATVRCLEAVDRKTGQANEGNMLLDAAASVYLALLGPFLTVRVLMEWWVRELIARREGYDVRKEVGFSPYRMLAWEICLTFLSAIGYVALNAFA